MISISDNMADGDIINHAGDEAWMYSDEVKEHFFNPQNFLNDDPEPGEFNAVGETGSSACGDVMRVWIKVDSESDRIKDFKWKTFGCASAIAATSMASVMVLEGKGMTLDEADKLKPQDVMERLGGLPARKVHCSVLAHQALRSAIENYRTK